MRIQYLDDLEDARELYDEFQVYHSRKDTWPGDDHTYWGLYDGKQPIGLNQLYFGLKKAMFILAMRLSSLAMKPKDCSVGSSTIVFDGPKSKAQSMPSPTHS